MTTLLSNLSAYFGQGKPPPRSDLVIPDGCDPFEKEDAVAFYNGKTWQDVLTYLQGLKSNPINGAAYYLEEWSVLGPVSMAYYLRAHLEYLLATLTSVTPDTDFVLHLLVEIQQALRINKQNPFTADQNELLKQLAQHICDLAAKKYLFAYQESDIENFARQLLVGLEANVS